ncbi:hypothetical protein BC829DRAFT_429980 [Chytridium lagenaria]|nr:hypothetical protein BC829DRAFT_429980 [Chytridium lagenaria]
MARPTTSIPGYGYVGGVIGNMMTSGIVSDSRCDSTTGGSRPGCVINMYGNRLLEPADFSTTTCYLFGNPAVLPEASLNNGNREQLGWVKYGATAPSVELQPSFQTPNPPPPLRPLLLLLLRPLPQAQVHHQTILQTTRILKILTQTPSDQQPPAESSSVPQSDESLVSDVPTPALDFLVPLPVPVSLPPSQPSVQTALPPNYPDLPNPTPVPESPLPFPPDPKPPLPPHHPLPSSRAPSVAIFPSATLVPPPRRAAASLGRQNGHMAMTEKLAGNAANLSKTEFPPTTNAGKTGYSDVGSSKFTAVGYGNMSEGSNERNTYAGSSTAYAGNAVNSTAYAGNAVNISHNVETHIFSPTFDDTKSAMVVVNSKKGEKRRGMAGQVLGLGRGYGGYATSTVSWLEGV